MRPSNLFFLTNKPDKTQKSFVIKSFLKKEIQSFDLYYDKNGLNDLNDEEKSKIPPH